MYLGSHNTECMQASHLHTDISALLCPAPCSVLVRVVPALTFSLLFPAHSMLCECATVVMDTISRFLLFQTRPQYHSSAWFASPEEKHCWGEGPFPGSPMLEADAKILHSTAPRGLLWPPVLAALNVIHATSPPEVWNNLPPFYSS